MVISNDLRQAKQTLSRRFLRTQAKTDMETMAYSYSLRNISLSRTSNVHAVGVGRKIVNEQETDTVAVRLYVPRKLPRSLLSPLSLLPAEIDGIPTDVIESPPAFAQAMCSDNKENKQRPIIAGISTGHFEITAGTIGYFCRSTRSGDNNETIYILSNNHVLADSNLGQAGDDIYQPGPADGGTVNDHFADLTRFINMRMGNVVNRNKVDAAIAELRAGINYTQEICSIGRITGTAQAEEQMEVRKHGRTTGYTEGKVTDEAYDTEIGYDTGVALFEDQIRIEPTGSFWRFTSGGDSGSLIVKKNSLEAVGLHFAGPRDNSYSIANHIGNVLTELQIALL